MIVQKMKEILVFGAGGHAKVTLDVFAQSQDCQIKGLLDDCVELHGTTRWGFPILGGSEHFPNFYSQGMTYLMVALGDNQLRKKIYEKAKKVGFHFESAIHPSAQIGGRVIIGAGTLLVAGSVVNVDSTIGENVIINTGSTVDHDCHIGSHAHLSPGVHLAGGVTIGSLAHVGIGAVVLPGLTVGEDSVIGAGSVVRENVPAGSVVVGNPAKELDKREKKRN